MSVQTRTCVLVVCDKCGKTTGNGEYDETHFDDLRDAMDYADDWLIDPATLETYCYNCGNWEDDRYPKDNGDLDLDAQEAAWDRLAAPQSQQSKEEA